VRAILGCGLLVERASGVLLPRALLPPLGLALLVVEADLLTMTGATGRGIGSGAYNSRSIKTASAMASAATAPPIQ